MAVVRILSASLEAHLISKLRVLQLSVGTCCECGHASWLVPLSPAGVLLGQLQHAARGVLATEMLLGTTLAAALVGVLVAIHWTWETARVGPVCWNSGPDISWRLGDVKVRRPEPAPAPPLRPRV